MTRFQVSMDDDLFNRLEEYADRNYITRSGAVCMAVNQFIMADDMRRAISDMAITMRRIAESNEIDDKSMAELKAFELLAQMFSGSSSGSPEIPDIKK
ncbi:MAG: hypothetical protein IIY78_00025 [Clostridia bacterium]|nr:hypothetical protein [Clostridia bacterium]MBQ1388002.1 hypothetical protein [Clostridia bacterium]